MHRSSADHFGVALAEIKDRKEHLLQLLSAFLVAFFGSDTKLRARFIERVAHGHEFLIVFKPHGTIRVCETALLRPTAISATLTSVNLWRAVRRWLVRHGQ